MNDTEEKFAVLALAATAIVATGGKALVAVARIGLRKLARLWR